MLRLHFRMRAVTALGSPAAAVPATSVLLSTVRASSRVARAGVVVPAAVGSLQQQRFMSTFKCTRGSVSVPNSPLTEFILENAHKHGDRPAYINGATGASISYKELPNAIGAAAEALSAQGFRAGNVLGIHLPNCPEFAIAFHAAAVLGGTVTTSNPLYTPRELAHQWSDAKADMVVSVGPLMGAVKEGAALVPNVTKVMDIMSKDCFVHARNGPPAKTVALNPAEKTVVVPYSSGTTGLPKGVMLSHKNLVANVAQICDNPRISLDISEAEVMIGVLPFFHIYGMTVIMNCGIRSGATVVTLPKFEPVPFLEACAKYKVNWAPIVPPIMLFLAKNPVVQKFDLSSMRIMFSGAAPLDRETQLAVQAKFPNVSVRQGYGMTETSPVTLVSCPDNLVAGSSGELVSNTEAKVVDPTTGKEIDEGDESLGELWVRGPQIMQGYLNRPDATAEMINPDGFLKTGDIVRRDNRGQFYVVDRIKELIKVQGFQVAPAELEGLLLEHPDIADVAVLGVPHPKTGEAPKAFVVLKPDHKLTEEQVKEFLASRVAKYKQLYQVKFVDAIPKSTAGKILKRLLKDQQ